MARHGIKAKIWTSIAIFGAGYLALLLLSLWTTSQTQRHMQIASESLFPAALVSQKASASFQKLVKHYNDAVMMQDRKSLASAEEEAQTLTLALASAGEKTSFDPELQKKVADLGRRFDDIHARSKKLYGAMVEHPDNMTPEMQSDIGALARDNKAMDAALVDLQESMSREFQNELAMVTTWSSRQRNFGILVLLIAVLCGGAVAGVVVEKNIVAPLRYLTACFRDIAQGDGDLTKRVEIVTHDELGELAACFNLFLEKLHGIMSQVAATAAQVATASGQLSSSTRRQAEGAGYQKDQATQVATAMQQMSTAVQQVSENCSHALEASERAAGTAREGGSVVEKTLTQMRSIAESVGGTAKNIGELGKRSDQIGRIAAVINDIADQTNLLALNAAIEAARAGEQGRGFAVVADEVRKLAERTTVATKEIAEMIASIQSGTQGAMHAMEIGTHQVEEGVAFTIQAGQSLEQIIRVSEEVGSMISHIATAASQELGTTASVNQSMDQITSLVSESAAASEESATACQSLSDLAHDLQQTVSTFKLAASAGR